MITDCRLQIADRKSAIANPLSSIRNPQSAIRNPKGPIAQPGQSYRLITGWSLVRIQVGPLPYKKDFSDASTMARMGRWQKISTR